MACSTWIAGD